MVIGTVVCLIIVIYAVVLVSNKSFEEKWRYQAPTFPSKGSVAAVVIIFALATIPVSYAASSISTDGQIGITLDEENFTVVGPMFDHTFVYSDIEQFYLDEDFDKGKRKMGYGTSTIKSGKFQNSQFGNYELASYAKVKPCIVIMVDSEYYAFNQASDKETQDLFTELKERITV